MELTKLLTIQITTTIIFYVLPVLIALLVAGLIKLKFKGVK